jgi:hypothetical protein
VWAKDESAFESIIAQFTMKLLSASRLHQRASYSTRDFETKHILGIGISIPEIT